MTPCKFTFDDGPVFDGFAHGSTWNGFDNVAVTAQERERIAAWMHESSVSGDAGDEVQDMMGIEPVETLSPDGQELYSLGWGYATQIVRGAVRYVVRDIATKGCDFLVWGDGDAAAAQVTLDGARADGLEVELVTMPADAMDPHTHRLITGESK